MKKIEKILQYLESQGISIAEFERRNELGNGYLKKTQKAGVDITNKMLERIRVNSKEVYAYLMGISEAEPPRGIKKEPEAGTSDSIKDKYITALERLVQQQESLLTSVQSQLTEVEQKLNEIKANQRISYSFQLAFQEYWVEHFQSDNGNQEAAQAKIGRIAFSQLQKLPEEGTLL